jgi:hypothetical protein
MPRLCEVRPEVRQTLRAKLKDSDLDRMKFVDRRSAGQVEMDADRVWSGAGLGRGYGAEVGRG